MANLTITLDDVVLRRARLKALENGTSVNRVLAEFLEQYVGGHEANLAARRAFVAQARSLAGRFGSGSGGRTWTREELHDRRK
jgi:hypothetical protein